MPRDTATGVLRRRQILDAARQIVTEDGLGALTFSRLEVHLGASRGVVTWHFRNKEELVMQLLDEAVAEVDAVALVAIRSEATLADRARAVVREMVRGWRTGAGAVLAANWGRADAPEAARSQVAALWERYRGYCADLVRIGQERGEFRTDIDPDELGAVLVALVLGIVLQDLAGLRNVDRDRVIAEAGEAVVARLRPMTA